LGKAALVTGGARRIGRAICLELARAGCDLAVHYRSSEADALQLAEEIKDLGRRATVIRADLVQQESWPTVVEQAVAALGRLDILINNASVFPTDRPDSLESFDPVLWDEFFALHVKAVMGLSRAAGPYLINGRPGRIVNLCDILTDRPLPDHLGYCVSKAALVALTRGLARSFAPDVLVNGVAPGTIEYPPDYSEELKKKLESRVPLGRRGSPRDVAGVVRFLCEEGNYLTGQIIAVDGGRSIS